MTPEQKFVHARERLLNTYASKNRQVRRFINRKLKLRVGVDFEAWVLTKSYQEVIALLEFLKVK